MMRRQNYPRRARQYKLLFASISWICLSVYAHPIDAKGGLIFRDEIDKNNSMPNDPIRTANNEANISITGNDKFSIASQDISGNVGQSIPLKIFFQHTDEVVVVSMNMIGLPRDFQLSDGEHLISSKDDREVIDITSWNVPHLAIISPSPRSDKVNLSMSVIWKPSRDGSIQISSTSFELSISKIEELKTKEANNMKNAIELGSGQSTIKSDSGSLRTEHLYNQAGIRKLPPVTGIEIKAESDITTQSTDQTTVSTSAVDSRVSSSSLPPAGQQQTSAAPLVERAKGLIRRGDISRARLLLQKARAMGEPSATFLLAQTWDPEVLRRWDVRGLKPDWELAQKLYAESSTQMRANNTLAATKH